MSLVQLKRFEHLKCFISFNILGIIHTSETEVNAAKYSTMCKNIGYICICRKCSSSEMFHSNCLSFVNTSVMCRHNSVKYKKTSISANAKKKQFFLRKK